LPINVIYVLTKKRFLPKEDYLIGKFYLQSKTCFVERGKWKDWERNTRKWSYDQSSRGKARRKTCCAENHNTNAATFGHNENQLKNIYYFSFIA